MTTRVFAVPPGVAFDKAFAEGFRTRHGALPPERIGRVSIIVNTARSREALAAAIRDTGPAAQVLPRIETLDDLAARPGPTLALPVPLGTVERTLLLTRMVERLIETERALGLNPAAAPDLAVSLGDLLAEFHDAGLPIAAIESAVADASLSEDAARHWETTLRFVGLIQTNWPAILADRTEPAIDKADHRTRSFRLAADAWLAGPPDAPVIAAASTGSLGTTAELLSRIATLDGGAVVLPGFDTRIDAATWAAVGPEHPMGPFRGLCDRLGIAPADVAPWVETEADTPRRSLIRTALRPAPVTDVWHALRGALGVELAGAVSGLALVEAPSPRAEAAAIARAIRYAVDAPGRTVALVTPDAQLARRVTAALLPDGIEPDDSLGKPLDQSPSGIFLRLVLDATAPDAGGVALAALLQHPFCQPGRSRADHRSFLRVYERTVLRTGAAEVPGAVMPPWPDTMPGGLDPAKHGTARDWQALIAAILIPLAEARRTSAPLSEMLGHHRRAAEQLSDDGTGETPKLYSGRDGPQTQAFLDKVEGAAPEFGDAPARTYAALFSTLFAGEQLRPDPSRPHPRVTILGPREARVLRADLTILAGLNEGVWPARPAEDPWLSRPMRARVGLPSPERTVGLAAHDFVQAVSGGDVILTRATKVEGTPTVESRWLVRLTNLIAGLEGGEAVLKAMKDRGTAYLERARRIAMPPEPVDRAPRPKPTPPVAVRPTRLSVTQIERLLRDPYAIYAEKILGLRVLDPLGRKPDYRERGILIHSVLEQFVRSTADAWPRDPEAALLALADAVLADHVPWPDLRRLWRARIARFAPWFVAWHGARRGSLLANGLERRGAMTVTVAGRTFEITARADRIDCDANAAAAVYDYKSGAVPSRDQIGRFNLQLQVQAAILARGGFDDLPAMTAMSGAYIGMAQNGKATGVDDLDQTTPDVMRKLVGLLGRYAVADWPYLPRLAMEKTRNRSDYDHLSRWHEWGARADGGSDA